MNSITFTKPKRISKRNDGLYQFQYQLKGLIESTITVFCKTSKEAVEHAKTIISNYMRRVNEILKISEKAKETLGIAPNKLKSGWSGIFFNHDTQRFEVELEINGQLKYIGNYKAKSIAVTALRKANIKNGLPEFQGKE